MDVTIRKMTAADIADVQAVVTTSWQATYAGIIPLDTQTKFLQQAYSEASLLKRIEQTHFFLATIGGKIVGFANFSNADLHGQVELGAIYLLPSVIGRGIGTTLLETGVAEIGRVKEVLVHVEQKNQQGIQFYKNKGFTFAKKFTEDFYGHSLEIFQYILTY